MAGHLQPPDNWKPDFPGQRPPFHAGNELAVTHGAYSAKRTDPVARRLLEEIASDPTTSYLASPKYHAQLWQWATAQARVEILTEYVDGMDLEDAIDSDRGKTSPLDLLRKWMTTAQGLANAMGFTPAAAARLGKDVATTQVDLARLLSMQDGDNANPDSTP